MTAVALDEPTIEAAVHLVRTHCAIAYPDGRRCLNCHARFPCPAAELGADLLLQAGWTGEQILAIDVRSGPWF